MYSVIKKGKPFHCCAVISLLDPFRRPHVLYHKLTLIMGDLEDLYELLVTSIDKTGRSLDPAPELVPVYLPYIKL